MKKSVNNLIKEIKEKRAILKFQCYDSDEISRVRKGSVVFTKYGDVFTINKIDFKNKIVYNESGDSFESHRISHVRSF